MQAVSVFLLVGDFICWRVISWMNADIIGQMFRVFLLPVRSGLTKRSDLVSLMFCFKGRRIIISDKLLLCYNKQTQSVLTDNRNHCCSRPWWQHQTFTTWDLQNMNWHHEDKQQNKSSLLSFINLSDCRGSNICADVISPKALCHCNNQKLSWAKQTANPHNKTTNQLWDQSQPGVSQHALSSCPDIMADVKDRLSHDEPLIKGAVGKNNSYPQRLVFK